MSRGAKPSASRQRTAAAQAIGLRSQQLISELGDERRHVAELADPAEPSEGRDRVVSKPLVDDGQGKVPGFRLDVGGEFGKGL